MVLLYVLLGLLQGMTEFLPVSSSGHLVAAQRLLGVESPGVLLAVCFHFGTLLAVLVVFRKDITRLVVDFLRGASVLLGRRSWTEAVARAPQFPMACAIIVGTIPAGLVGVLLHDQIEAAFAGDVRVVGAMLVATGLILLASRDAPDATVGEVGPVRGLFVGVAQAIAILPGISRSGATIVGGYFLGIRRDMAARFSFLLSVPVVAGAAALEMKKALGSSAGGGPGLAGEALPLVCGTAAAFVAGWICLILLMKIVQGDKLHWFAAYCIPLGAALTIFGASI